MQLETIRQINGGTMYINGGSCVGQLESATLPEVSLKQSEYNGTGLFGSTELPVGFEKMELTVKFKSIYSHFATLMNGIAAANVQVRFGIEEWSNGTRTRVIPGVAYLRVRPKKLPTKFELKQASRTEHEATLGAESYRLVVDGSELLDIDITANRYVVNGSDLLADWRAAQGQ